MINPSMINPRTIEGIKFFEKASDCISNYQNTPWISRALSTIQSYGTLLAYALNKISLILHKVESQMVGYTNPPADGFTKPKLIVCIHGLNNNPAQFKQTVDEMQKLNPCETDIFIPYVLQKGNAKLDEMVKPIFKVIKDWAATEGEKELVLVGISNGGRISRAIEAKLIKTRNKGKTENITKFRFVSIVGACKGSTLAALANKLHLSWILSKNISEEMPTNSKRNKQLDEDWAVESVHPPVLIRNYAFIASADDWQVPNYDSTLMEIPNRPALYAIIPGHGHNSIVNAAAKAVAVLTISPYHIT